VLVAEEDFTSVLFPVLQTQNDGVDVIVVPLDKFIENIDESIDWVAVSAVQSSDGRILDLDALAEACRQNHTRSYVDLTQAAGWLEINAEQFDITATGAYKWLLCPRGTGFMTVKPELWHELQPVAPGWYAGEKPWDSIYRPPLRLANSARRFDISPAWVCWAGAAPALELLAEIGPGAIGTHNMGLAAAFAEPFGIPDHDSAIVSIEVAADKLGAAREAGIVFSSRGGNSRFAFHLYNSMDEVEFAVNCLAGD